MVNMSPYLSESEAKKSKKARRTTLNWPFKKNALKSSHSLDGGLLSFAAGCTTSASITPFKSLISGVGGNAGGNSKSKRASNGGKCKFFGKPLSAYITASNEPCAPLLHMLTELYNNGPSTVGIFRKSANARICRELRAQLDSDASMSIAEYPVTVIGSVFKEFLRSLPDCLLQSKLYAKWIEAAKIVESSSSSGSTPAHGGSSSNGTSAVGQEKVIKLLRALPVCNLVLIRYFFSVLWSIAKHADVNMMTSSNLAVCIGPSLLTPIGGQQLTSITRCEVS